MAESDEGQAESPHGSEGRGHRLPTPTIFPAGFAAGVALLLVGLVVSWPVVAIGAGLAVVFGFLWAREATSAYRGVPEPAPPAAPAEEVEEVVEPPRYTRGTFISGATLGLGAAIGAVITVPVVGLTVAPAFVGQGDEDIDLGPLENFPEGQFVVATFRSKPEEGKVSLRTAYIRSNGIFEGVPSFTILSNRCVHLGCPVQPQGPLGEPQTVETGVGQVTLRTTQPAGFGCPCHGGAYDSEGNPTAGPPVRALDRYRYRIENGRLVLLSRFSVGRVSGEGAIAKLKAYERFDPGAHVDGPTDWLYPLGPN